MWEYYDNHDSVISEQAAAFNRSKPGDRQPWSVIPLARVKKIWADFARMGFVRDEKGIEMIQEIIINNIKKVHANTVLAGHTPTNPDKLLEGYGYEPLNETPSHDYGDWIMDENGQWRISDYAMNQLVNLAMELIASKTPEKKLIKIDQILNVVHQRSDIAGWFIEGGSKGLDEIFNQKI